MPKCWWHQMGAPGATPELPKVSWLADGDSGPAGKGKLEHGSHLKRGKPSCCFGMLEKTGQEQLGKSLGGKWPFHLAMVFKATKYFGLSRQKIIIKKKPLVILSSSNCQLLSSRSRGFLFSHFSFFWGCNYFKVKMPNYSTFPDFCHWKGVSRAHSQLKWCYIFCPPCSW